MKVSSRSISILHRRKYLDDSEAFLWKFRQGATLPREKDALSTCINLCRLADLGPNKLNPNAARILLGKVESEEKDQEKWFKNIPDLILTNTGDVKNRLVSSDLKTLLSMRDPEIPVFSKGRNIFKKILCSVGNCVFHGQ